MTGHPLFTDRELAYIRRTPLRAESLAADYGVPASVIRDIRNGAG